MPQMSGVDVCRHLSGRAAPALILLTTFDDERDISAGLSAGARGFLLKDADAAEIARAIHHVAAGGATFSRWWRKRWLWSRLT